MPTLTLPVGSLISIGGNEISEHNRNPVSISTNRIEKIQRMANGTLRKFFVADKKVINVSWTSIPSYAAFTVDGKWGARNIKEFYEGVNGRGSFAVTVKYGNTANAENLTMIFTSCSFELVRRNARKNAATDVPQELWDVSISLEEV